MQTPPRSPLAPPSDHVPAAVPGVRFASVEAGIRYAGRKDLMVAAFDEGTVTAGVLTRSRCPSAPVEWCRARLDDGAGARALVVNAGNANAFTGRRGREAAEETAQIAADALGCEASEVWLASTGVIGEPMAVAPFADTLRRTAADVSNAPQAVAEAATTIMTTDTFPKSAHRTLDLGGDTITITGIAKGSGMIAPDMATMLAFVFTDAAVSREVLQALLARTVRTTFNAITVDGDTSTSDTLLAFATGASGAPAVTSEDDPRSAAFAEAFRAVIHDLAMLTVRDGEGATKLVSVTVTGARDEAGARGVAMSVANSPLVKTAVAGEDANWGRVVMAVGKAGFEADRDRLGIRFGDVEVARDGARAPNYDEEAASATMRGREIDIAIDLGLGEASYTAWTCDLTHGYIDINADYRS